MEQPDLPKYVASTLRLMCLGVISLEGVGLWSRKAWKYLVSCLEEISVLVKEINCSIDIPEDIHLVKSSKHFAVLYLVFLGREKVLEHILHLNLVLEYLSLPQITVCLLPQLTQAKW